MSSVTVHKFGRIAFVVDRITKNLFCAVEGGLTGPSVWIFNWAKIANVPARAWFEIRIRIFPSFYTYKLFCCDTHWAGEWRYTWCLPWQLEAFRNHLDRAGDGPARVEQINVFEYRREIRRRREAV